jgi:hypothetical protein
MNKYIPKVGEAFEWKEGPFDTWHKEVRCIVHSKMAVGYEHLDGWINNVSKKCEFRPIPTEREKLFVILKRLETQLPSDIAREIQQAGFTIPKKIKRSELFQVVANTSTAIVQNDELVVDAICNLLGDLVEYKRGGAL